MSNYSDAIDQIIKKNKGFVTTTQITKLGIPRRCLSDMLAEGTICKAARGIYTLPEVWEDDLYFLQYRFSKGIFSHETALYLHSMTDRTPISYTMTFPTGYNTTSARKQGIITKTATVEDYGWGVVEVLSPCGNKIEVYDIERTLCDVVKTRHGGDIQVTNQAMKSYAASKTKNVAKLMKYADALQVKSKILTYMEILL